MPMLAPPFRFVALIATAILLTSLASGCKTTAQKSESNRPTEVNNAQKDAEVLETLEQEYAIGPRAARSLGYRLGWQTPDAGKSTTMISPQHDSIFVLSADKNLQRLTASTGTRIWSISAGTPASEILGINYLKTNDRVYITHQGEITSVSAATGSLTSDEGRSPIQSLQWMANTAPALYEDNFIYGSKGGDLVWQAFNIGYSYKAFNIGKIIDVKPLLVDDMLIGIARSGEVAAMSAADVKLRWKHTLLDQITASPATNGSVLYVSCLDQYLRAFDLDSGRLLWRALTETPLAMSPVVIGDAVYQQIPGTGLASYEALPVNRYDGRRLWIAENVDGEVVTIRNGRLLVWNQDQRILDIVSGSTGVVESSMSLDGVQMIISDNQDNGRLYVLDDRGHLDCLIPLN